MEKLSHAYIVSSASQEAGLARATELAAEILCSGTGKKPCGVCRDCRKVKAGVHPDLGFVRRPLDDKGNKKRDIQVDQIRDMGADAYVLPNEASGKVYIIEEAETMNESAQNAALKLFEEPPAGVHFILCTANPEKLLVTVRSRCAMIRCNSGSEPENREMAELADEYIRLVQNGNNAELTAWCMENERLDARKLPDFLNSVERRLVQELRYSDAKKQIMENIELIDRCIEYQMVNTSVRHIFGLLAVRSLPAKETRKKVD
ncbi:MAG: DNA polymerase III subunit [Oscillospiraceae bacterium]|nr:DNA polymerase III subunit [Oscillospiraceae bacterium]